MGLIGFSGIRWLQFKEEVDQFVALLLEEGVRSYLEIGAHQGDTLHYIGSALPEGSLLVGVDLPGASAGRYYNSWERLENACRDLEKQGKRAHSIIGDSRDPTVIAKARELGPYDCVFIDGDHSFEGCRADWRNYGPMGRIVAFHDICQVSRPRKCRVFEVYRSACNGHRHREITIGAGRRGIGVVWR